MRSTSTAVLWGVSSLGQRLPRWAKAPLRRLGRNHDTDLLTPSARQSLTAEPEEPSVSRGLRSHLSADLANGRGLILREYQEAIFARHGLEVSHPYLDRDLVSFVASIPATSRPLLAGNKALIRMAFLGLLPDSVLDRTAKTLGNTWIDRVIAEQGPEFVKRFPTVLGASARYLEADRYASALTNLPSLDAALADDLWNAWSLQLWLEVLDTADVQDP
jgi:asparagine synthetase B (glutamine-hydrolysing)